MERAIYLLVPYKQAGMPKLLAIANKFNTAAALTERSGYSYMS